MFFRRFVWDGVVVLLVRGVEIESGRSESWELRSEQTAVIHVVL